jgi:hypothetical protein
MNALWMKTVHIDCKRYGFGKVQESEWFFYASGII